MKNLYKLQFMYKRIPNDTDLISEICMIVKFLCNMYTVYHGIK